MSRRLELSRPGGRLSFGRSRCLGELANCRGSGTGCYLEGLLELMLQAKVPENPDRLEEPARALDLTKLPRHLT